MSIQTDRLDAGYGKQPLIKDITLFAGQETVLTLIGPNGSGKSTVLKSITRQLRKMGGTVYLDGTDMETLKGSQIAKGMSIVMTEPLRTELMSCRDVVSTGRYPYTGRLGILNNGDWEAVDRALEAVGAKEIAHKDFMKTSDGQRQRIMLARAICQDTRTLILDEPVSFLDMKYKLDILGNIRRMAREKRLSVILSLHELDLARMVSDVVACVDGEKIERIGTPEDIFTGNYIQTLYGVEPGNFDPVLGNMYLPGVKGEPEVFVIGGGGSGIPAYYYLQRKNIPFAAGVLCENDLEYSAAKALAAEVVSSPAFHPIGDRQVEKGKQLIDQCKNCLCMIEDFGPVNARNRELLEYAVQLGKRKHWRTVHGKGNYDTRHDVECWKELADGRALQDF